MLLPSTHNRIAPRIRKRLREREPVPRLQKIKIRGLFGKYDFDDIDITKLDGSISNVTFLYGDNGVGKTTILKLIYAILSPERNNGLRGLIGKTIFLEFGVMFEDEQWIHIKKNKADDLHYRYIFEGPRSNDTIPIVLNELQRVAVSENPEMERLWLHLDSLSPTIVFLNDNRTVRSSYGPWDVRSSLTERLHTNRRYAERPVEADADAIANAGLEQLLQQSHSILRDRALLSNAVANAGTGQIYAAIAKTLSKSSYNPEKASDTGFGELIYRIDSIQKYLDIYGPYGLSSADQIKDIKKSVEAAPPNARAQMIELIEPYIASVEQRINANRGLAEQIYAFERGINNFLNRKKMVCKIDRPIIFIDEAGKPLEATSLSSGERHLIYLCCVAMLSRERQCIIVVDEPELSLNYKWQKKLIKSLLEIAGTGAQFIMASHSFEIISSFRESAIDLEPKIARA